MQLKGGLSSWKAVGITVQVNCNPPISLFRQVQIVAGSLVAIKTGLDILVSPWFLLLSGLVVAWCLLMLPIPSMGMLSMKLPYNRKTL